VKIGVTLGAQNFLKGRDGKVGKDGKRHPTIEDNVTIYVETIYPLTSGFCFFGLSFSCILISGAIYSSRCITTMRTIYPLILGARGSTAGINSVVNGIDTPWEILSDAI